MKSLFNRCPALICLAFLCNAFAFAQNNSTLRFNPEGKFKIVQFTDVHFKYNNSASDDAIACINEVLKAEKPDLVIFTGDIVYSAPADSGMRRVLEQVSAQKIPFATTFGNHDDEHGMSRSALYDLIRKVPYNLLPDRGASPSPDYVLTIKSSSDGAQDAALLYCMDSNAYSPLGDVKGYGWFSAGQVQWYRDQSAAFKSKNNGQAVPALAYFHIPLPEYLEAVTNASAVVRGTRMERVCCPAINTGMFAAMKECGDVMATFVGHDHDNDFAAMWHNILLTYGRYTGGNTVYNHLPNGARIVLLEEGKRSFTTWIRLRDGQTIDRYVYPDGFVREK